MEQNACLPTVLVEKANHANRILPISEGSSPERPLRDEHFGPTPPLQLCEGFESSRAVQNKAQTE